MQNVSDEELLKAINAPADSGPSDEELLAAINGTPATKSFKPPTNIPAEDTNKYLEAQGFTINEAPDTPMGIEKPARELFIQGAGAVHGATWGAADEIYGAGKAALDVALTDKTFTEFNSLRRHHTDVAREKFEELRQESPLSFGYGEFVGGAATTAFTGGGSLIAGAAIGGGMAGTQEYMTKDDPKFREVFKSTMIGAGLGAIPSTLKGVGKAASYAGEKLGISQAFGGVQASMNKKIRQWITKNNSNEDEFASLLLDKKLSDGTPLIAPGQSVDDTFDALEKAKNETAEQMNNFLQEAEKQVNPDSAIIMGDKLMSYVTALKAQAMGKTTIKNKIIKNADGGDFAIDEAFLPAEQMATINFQNQSFKLSEFNRTISDLESKVNWKDVTNKPYEKLIIKQAKQILNDAVDALPENVSSAPLRQLKKEYGLYKEMMDEVAKNVDRKKSPFSLVKDSIIGGGVAAATGNPLLGAAAIAGRLIANSDTAQGAAGASLRRIGDAYEQNPEKWGKIIQGIGLAAHGSYSDFDNEVAYADSVISLHGDPIKRTKEDLLAKKDKLLSIMYKFDSNAANMLAESLDNYDYGTAGLIFQQVAKDSRFNFVIEKGIGFDGKIVDETDKAQLMNEMTQGQASRTLSTAQKLEGFKALKQGLVPQLNAAPQAIPPALQNVINRIPKRPKELPY